MPEVVVFCSVKYMCKVPGVMGVNPVLREAEQKGEGDVTKLTWDIASLSFLVFS